MNIYIYIYTYINAIHRVVCALLRFNKFRHVAVLPGGGGPRARGAAAIDASRELVAAPAGGPASEG